MILTLSGGVFQTPRTSRSQGQYLWKFLKRVGVWGILGRMENQLARKMKNGRRSRPMDESIPSGYQNSRPACFTVIFMIWTKIDSGRLARNLILGRLCCVLIGCLFCVSCEKNESLPARTNKPITMTWSQELDASRKTILQSDWHTAGVAWANIRKKGLTPEELDAWLAFQTEILSSTKNDALKSSLRKSAMQEMYYSPLQSSRYLVWLEQGLATNLFIEGDTIEKAQQLVHDIKQVKSTSNN